VASGHSSGIFSFLPRFKSNLCISELFLNRDSGITTFQARCAIVGVMKIGVPKEVKNLENRVALVRAGVLTLVSQGHQVLVQKGAGLGSGITDEDYAKNGARIVETAKEAWDVDMVIKVKEPQKEEFPLMKEGLYLFTYLHLANEPELTLELMKRKVRAIAYETIQLNDGTLPLLRPMSEVAGRMAPQIGAHYLEKSQGGLGVLLGGTPGVARGQVTIIGGGVAGANAAKIAVGLGARVNIIERSQKRLEYLDDIFGSTVNTLMSNAINIEESILKSDLVIGSILIPGAKASKLVTKEHVAQMKKGSVLVDIAIDQGGCFETSKPTSHQNPVYTVDGVLHYCVTNMPGAVARTSTYALTNHTLPYACSIAADPIAAIRSDAALALGVNCWDGHCTYKQVADDVKVDFAPLAKLL
jgi:alanine dehydrogenase